MKTLRLLLAAGLLVAGLFQAIRAEETEKPVVQFKNKSIEESLTIDSKLQAYPKLYAKLVAAGKHELAKWAADAEEERKTNPDEFAGDRRWYIERGYSVRSIIGRYVSIVFGDDTYGGGAHPNHYLDTLLWDAQADKFINISPFFKETRPGGPTLKALAKSIRAALAVAKKAKDFEVKDPETDFELAAVKPKLTALGGIALAPSTEKDRSSGFSVYFSPYAVGSYAEGPYTVFVPWTTFKAYLSPAGAKLFAGERPASDKDE
ncbi:MAG TPA: hypothetical protein VE224_10885 [Pseudolabrys sp.]|nr:hypothetical protein [Pseudolabrys sp.]